MQPTYLPWLGYFDLMDQVDSFVLLDDVQFVKQSWQQRNRIKTPRGLEWLTVPVFISGRFGQKINEAQIQDPRFWVTHTKTLDANYARAGHFRALASVLAAEYEAGATTHRLADLHTRLIIWLAGTLDIKTPLVRSSALGVAAAEPCERLVSLCRHFGASEYISPVGAAGYLLPELNTFRAAGVNVRFHQYRHPEYPQLHGAFLPYASAVDLLFNTGPGAGTIMRSGRLAPCAPEELPPATVSTPDESAPDHD
jgi:hypothetical protein